MRSKQGNAQTIDFKYDGGFNPDTWYNIRITAQQSFICIYMTDVQVNIDKRYVKVFEFVDNQLVHGTIAFSSFGISFLLIDNIVVVPIPCTDFNQDKSEVQQIITPTCPRFSENFKNNYLSRWTALEPIQSINGPSSWKILNNEDNREIILSQESKISGLSEYEEGTIYLLKDKNIINNIICFS